VNLQQHILWGRLIGDGIAFFGRGALGLERWLAAKFGFNAKL
jgi:hypothetical protein